MNTFFTCAIYNKKLRQQLSEGWPCLQRLLGEFRDLIGLAASLPVGLNRFGHIQIFMVAIYAKLQRIFEMAIGYVVKHNRLPRLFHLKSLVLPKSLLFYSGGSLNGKG